MSPETEIILADFLQDGIYIASAVFGLYLVISTFKILRQAAVDGPIEECGYCGESDDPNVICSVCLNDHKSD